jgi:hypothetical protein
MVCFLQFGETIYSQTRKQTLKRKNLLLAMLEATLFERNPKSQWLGDYPQEAAKKRANRR